MTVIYGNMGDMDTSLLPYIWEGFEAVNVVEIGKKDFDYAEKVEQAIADEDDTLIICGHGTKYGLLHPDFYSGRYIIHENNYRGIHAKKLICIWCHASEFAEMYHVNGFFSSMFISNINEAYTYGFYGTQAMDIEISECAFCKRINALLKDNVPLEEWVTRLNNKLNESNEVEKYNYNGLKFYKDYEGSI